MALFSKSNVGLVSIRRQLFTPVAFDSFSDTRLPDYDPRDLKLRDVELQREKKWCKMLQEWHKYENTEKLHKRIYKGIPNSLRGRVWAQLLNVPKLQQEQKNKYEVGSSAIFVKRGNESVLQVLDVSSSGNENACTQVVARHPADWLGRQPNLPRPRELSWSLRDSAEEPLPRSRCILHVQPRDRLLSGHVPDRGLVTHVHGGRRSFLGPVGFDGWQAIRDAWWASYNEVLTVQILTILFFIVSRLFHFGVSEIASVQRLPHEDLVKVSSKTEDPPREELRRSADLRSQVVLPVLPRSSESSFSL